MPVSIVGDSHVYIELCNEANEMATATLNGSISFVNPYGYLDADEFSLFYVYIAFITGYAFAILLYLVYFCKRVEYATSLNYILFVLSGLITAELVVRFIHTAIFNSRSESSVTIDTLVVLFNLIRNTGLRMLIMLLANGYALWYLPVISSNFLKVLNKNIWIMGGLAGVTRLVYLLVSDVKYSKYFLSSF